MNARVRMPGLVREYCDGLERLRALRDKGELSPEDDQLLEDGLTHLWNLMSVEECREVEERYPALRIERI